MAPVFNFPISELLPLKFYWLLPILGIVTGLAGVIYNAVLIGLNKHMKNLFAKHPMLRPMPVFIIAVFIGLYFPSALGGGHHLLDIINLKTTLIVLMGTLLIKFLFSVFSFSSGVPGGIFFPLLLLGALIGGIFGDIFIPLHGLNNALFYNFVVFAMAGLFSGIVRAPITGIVLLTEMTNSFSHLLPISIVAIFAFVTANALGSKPVYDSLLDGMLEKYKPATENNHAKVMIEQVVEFSARAVNAPIRDLNMPSNALIVSIHRNDMDITPNGNTVILPNDIIQVVTDSVSEPAVRELVQNLFTYDSPEGIDPNDSIEQ
jgi:H+/Cl- antiporter ClcA